MKIYEIMLCVTMVIGFITVDSLLISLAKTAWEDKNYIAILGVAFFVAVQIFIITALFNI